MKQDDRKIEDVDMFEDYEMIPLEPMMYGYDQMNMMPCMDFNQSYDMAMGFRQDVNPNAEIYPMEPNMEMDTDTVTGMNPWMQTGEFNESMFMSGFNPMRMMYGDVSIKNSQDENDVDSIVRKIERYNPLVFRQLSRYGMPYAQAKAVVRRIVRLTLMYSEE
jgi:hypothetical protein